MITKNPAFSRRSKNLPFEMHPGQILSQKKLLTLIQNQELEYFLFGVIKIFGFFSYFISGRSVHSPDSEDRRMIRRAVMSDAPFAALGLDDTAVAVVNRDVAGVADDVAGLRLREGVDLLSC